MTSVKLTDVSLSYSVFRTAGPLFDSAAKPVKTGGLIQRSGRRMVEVRALRDVNLEIGHGERVGVIGPNGAGKTTLLKVLAGIYRPQAGSINRSGKTVAIINPGVGLDQGLSGYDNIEMIGLLSGLTRGEIRQRTPDIEAFTELGEFLSLPVSTYSAGMMARLAFGVATSLDPEILIADEKLGTGDAHFIERARDRMQAMMDRSSILVLASHSVTMLKQLCTRAILMDHGQLVADGPVDELVARYQEETRRRSAA